MFIILHFKNRQNFHFLIILYPYNYAGDHELASSPSSPQVPVRKDSRVKPIQNKNLSLQSKKCNTKRQLNNQLGKEKEEGVIVGDRVDDDSIRPLSADEDYIVFSFREDGAFDVVEDCKGGVIKSEAHRGVVDGIKHKNSRPVNRKVHTVIALPH